MHRRRWMAMMGIIAPYVLSGEPYSFVLDASRPFVYLKFRRIGPRKPARKGESPVGLWLDLVNNCRIPITVFGHDLGTGDPGVALDYQVVRDNSASGSSTQLPEGYSYDVGSSLVVASGKSLLFSVPADHVTDDWHIEIDIRLDDSPRKVKGTSPRVVVSFFSADIPKSTRP